MKLVKKLKYSGTIEVRTGLHIGGNKDSYEIGGVDSPVIKDALTGQPYIPGSSIKGKMRSLLEIAAGKTNTFKSDNSSLSKLFGCLDDNKKDIKGNASRLLFRDAFLKPESEELLRKAEFTDLKYTQIKTENTIDRVTGQSKAGLRQIERVPRGAVFSIEIVLNVMENESEEEYKKLLNKGIKLINHDYLGGSGSRGYGQVEILLSEPEVINIQ